MASKVELPLLITQSKQFRIKHLLDVLFVITLRVMDGSLEKSALVFDRARFTTAFISYFGDLLDLIIVDVAYECHRIATLGLDRNFEEKEEELRLSAQTRVRVADPSNSGPSVANEVFECMICGRSIVARRFAHTLEKCMRKGRKAHLKVTRSSTAAQTWNSWGNPAATYSTYSCSNSTSRLSNEASGVAGEECSNGALE